MRQNNISPSSAWSTSSFGETADTSILELSALGEHLGLCRASHGGLFRLRCAAETVHGFVAPRFFTSLLLALLCLMAGSALLG